MSTTLSTLVREGLHLRARATGVCAIRRLASTVPSPNGPPDDDGQYIPIHIHNQCWAVYQATPTFSKKKVNRKRPKSRGIFRGTVQAVSRLLFLRDFYYLPSYQSYKPLPPKEVSHNLFQKQTNLGDLPLLDKVIVRVHSFQIISHSDLRVSYRQAQSARWQDTPWKKRNECIPAVCRGAIL